MIGEKELPPAHGCFGDENTGVGTVGIVAVFTGTVSQKRMRVLTLQPCWLSSKSRAFTAMSRLKASAPRP